MNPEEYLKITLEVAEEKMKTEIENKELRQKINKAIDYIKQYEDKDTYYIDNEDIIKLIDLLGGE